MSSDKTNNERLAVVETKLISLEEMVKNTNNGIADIKKSVGDILLSLESKADKEDVDRKLANLGKANKLTTILTGIISAVSGSIITYLVLFYLQNK